LLLALTAFGHDINFIATKTANFSAFAGFKRQQSGKKTRIPADFSVQVR
jgi:hypothetical protein